MIDYDKLQLALAAAGLIPDTISAGSLQRCKVDGDRRGKKSGAYVLHDDERPTCWWQNHKTGDSGVWVAASDRPMTEYERRRQHQRIEQARRDRQRELTRQWAANRVKLMALWNNAVPVTDSDPAGRYLINRCLTAVDADVLRHHSGLDYWHEGQCVGRFPAMLAAVTSPTGELITLHRTFLTLDGRKAPVPTVKKLCSPAGVMAGASIKVGLPTTRSDDRLGIGIAEGIETAIAASILFGVPTWAAVSANGLARFIPPAAVRNVYVFADNDASKTGQRSAVQLAERLTCEGYTVRIQLPPAVGSDWADELIMTRAIV